MSAVLIDCGLCRLRPYRMTDAKSLVAHANNPKVTAWVRDRFPNPYTLRDAKEFLRVVSHFDKDVQEFVLAIEVDGEACGGIGIIRGTDIERVSAELGYWLGEKYWGRGIVTAAIKKFAPYVMDRFHLTRLHADTFVENPASGRVLQKAGFSLESVKRRAAIKRGVVRDLQCWVLTR